MDRKSSTKVAGVCQTLAKSAKTPVSMLLGSSISIWRGSSGSVSTISVNYRFILWDCNSRRPGYERGIGRRWSGHRVKGPHRPSFPGRLSEMAISKRPGEVDALRSRRAVLEVFDCARGIHEAAVEAAEHAERGEVVREGEVIAALKAKATCLSHPIATYIPEEDRLG